MLSNNGSADWIEGEPEHQPLAPGDDSGPSFWSFSRLGRSFLAATESTDGDAENPPGPPPGEQLADEHNKEFGDDASEGAIDAGTRDISAGYSALPFNPVNVC